MFMLEIRNVVLPNGRRGCIQIQDGTIVGITDEPQYSGGIDGNGYLVLPGLIDGHVHDRVSGYPEFDEPDVENVATVARAAILGGVTTIIVMPNPKRPTTTIEALEHKLAAIGEQPITYDIHFGATPDNIGEIRQLKPYRPRVRGVKLYLAKTTGNVMITELADQVRAAEACLEVGLPAPTHAEDQVLLEANRASFGDRQPALADHCLIRSTEVEMSGVKRGLLIHEQTGCPIHFCHISAPESLLLIDDARQAGADVTVEVCPHHISRTNDDLLWSRGAFFKVNPALRTPGQMVELCDLTVHGDYVNSVGSDHAPHSLSAKYRMLYDDIPSGMTGVQTMFNILFDMVARGLMPLARFIELTSAGPARIFGYKNKGRIGVGADADLIIVDPAAEVEIRDEKMASPCRWTPYHGLVTRGAIMGVMAKGRLLSGDFSLRK